MHGLLCSSACWVVSGPENSLAYILSDAGYDVWLGNARGSLYSRKHVSLSTLDKEYWDFSWHEIATRDLPATIDYILKTTGQEKLFYLGHSQGTTTFFVMASEMPEYQNKIQAMFAMAPVAYCGRITSAVIQLLARFMDSIDTLLPIVLGHIPAGASTKQIMHYTQLVKSGQFRQYDYGWLHNKRKYGSFSPPIYDLKKIQQVPISLHYSSNDWLANIKDVNKLYTELGNPYGKFRVPHDKFNHLDYMWANDVKSLLYDKILSLMTHFRK
ncbi:hypothetical protein ACFW04_004349 [Cataglyphis niger]